VSKIASLGLAGKRSPSSTPQLGRTQGRCFSTSTAYKVDADAIALKVKQEFAAKEKAKLAKTPSTKAVSRQEFLPITPDSHALTEFALEPSAHPRMNKGLEIQTECYLIDARTSMWDG
jgi:hypothetical protein